ncbi:cysteine-rich with EGF-like domain protein 2 [Leptopilina boulardi]|uniref:cysteine-rich with EGF-like domain protein 2 n=1 Tax=Leptopilina boulardi TaxID=63433 RepID=UPI0021F52909|nr:cysteine-rich with EGF-like domain protein 2 [Leptopilina boulardi]
MLKFLVFHPTFVFLLLIITCQVFGNRKSKITDEELFATQLPPCAACKELIKSFIGGMNATKRGKYEGGDSAWEEDKLGSYSRSELRFTEIQELMCKDVKQGKNQCHYLADEYENILQEWWFKEQDKQTDIYAFVCIEKLKHCCPDKHFGKNCDSCPGYPDKVCHNNGKCKGSGTRKGNGQCLCEKGYAASDCSECDSGFYQVYKDENKFLCTACHSSCAGPCNGPGPRNCINCSKGWQFVKDKGCLDIDECIMSEKPCKTNQFCVNEEGFYKCLECDKVCNGCIGDGPDMCIKCADGYHKKDNFCIHSDTHGRKKAENVTRYITYFGLVVATSIIFKRNIYAASFIGLLVGLYITVSEYMVANTNIQDSITNLDILGPVT